VVGCAAQGCRGGVGFQADLLSGLEQSVLNEFMVVGIEGGNNAIKAT